MTVVLNVPSYSNLPNRPLKWCWLSPLQNGTTQTQNESHWQMCSLTCWIESPLWTKHHGINVFFCLNLLQSILVFDFELQGHTPFISFPLELAWVYFLCEIDQIERSRATTLTISSKWCRAVVEFDFYVWQVPPIGSRRSRRNTFYPFQSYLVEQFTNMIVDLVVSNRFDADLKRKRNVETTQHTRVHCTFATMSRSIVPFPGTNWTVLPGS